MSNRKRIATNRKREYRLLKSKKQLAKLAIEGHKLANTLQLAMQVTIQAIQIAAMAASMPIKNGGVIVPINQNSKAADHE